MSGVDGGDRLSDIEMLNNYLNARTDADDLALTSPCCSFCDIELNSKPLCKCCGNIVSSSPDGLKTRGRSSSPNDSPAFNHDHNLGETCSMEGRDAGRWTLKSCLGFSI
jgi:hypothetical protein